jgi:ABC-type multidrug transport system ATPase subunit
MEKMDLTKVRDTRIGTIYARGISGGQQRRVCTAVDLASNPTVMFLDEPTSGLDTTTAVNNLRFIKEKVQLSAETYGRSAMVTLHQPNNELLAVCDNILLLVEGKAVFFGTVLDARAYFTSIGYAPSAALASPPTEVGRAFSVIVCSALHAACSLPCASCSARLDWLYFLHSAYEAGFITFAWCTRLVVFPYLGERSVTHSL